jgi:NADH:ubiquinone oxidoreductase subunit
VVYGDLKNYNPSSICAEWHGWINYMNDFPPTTVGRAAWPRSAAQRSAGAGCALARHGRRSGGSGGAVAAVAVSAAAAAAAAGGARRSLAAAAAAAAGGGAGRNLAASRHAPPRGTRSQLLEQGQRPAAAGAACGPARGASPAAQLPQRPAAPPPGHALTHRCRLPARLPLLQHEYKKPIYALAHAPSNTGQEVYNVYQPKGHFSHDKPRNWQKYQAWSPPGKQ